LFRTAESESLTLVKVYPWEARGKKIGHFLVAARSTSLSIYTVDVQGNLTQTDSAPIQAPPFQFIGGPLLTSDASSNHLFVATNDGVPHALCRRAGRRAAQRRNR
jgi:hypothetical protein